MYPLHNLIWLAKEHDKIRELILGRKKICSYHTNFKKGQFLVIFARNMFKQYEPKVTKKSMILLLTGDFKIYTMVKFRSNRNSFRYPADRKTVCAFDKAYIDGDTGAWCSRLLRIKLIRIK